MKKQITRITPVIIMAAVIIYFSSCSKEELNPSVMGTENATGANERFCNSQVFPPNAHMY